MRSQRHDAEASVGGIPSPSCFAGLRRVSVHSTDELSSRG
jgi:hypothetical protein